MAILENIAMSGSGISLHQGHNGNLIKLDGSISPSESIDTASPGDMEFAMPEEQKLVKKKGGRKPVSSATYEEAQAIYASAVVC